MSGVAVPITTDDLRLSFWKQREALLPSMTRAEIIGDERMIAALNLEWHMLSTLIADLRKRP